MGQEQMTMVLLPEEEWQKIKDTQSEILNLLKDLKLSRTNGIASGYITAKEFMDAVRIKRTKFDQLVQTGKLKTIKRYRKIYVRSSEVERYFGEG